MTHWVLTAAFQHGLEVKKSRFLAHALPCENPEAALAELGRVADPEATHNCWAYRIGVAYRSSDDGEPAGTAGRPILAAIDGSGLDRLIVVVTRWFGGIKLGAGGLVRAYGGCAAECLRQAPRQVREVQADCLLLGGFEHLGVMYQLIEQFAALKLDEQHDSAGARLRLRLQETQLERFRQQLRDATRGQARCLVEGR